MVQGVRRVWFLFSLWTGLTAIDDRAEYVCALVLVVVLFIIMPLWLLRSVVCLAADALPLLRG